MLNEYQQKRRELWLTARAELEPIAKALGMELGISPATAARIVCSSMRFA